MSADPAPLPKTVPELEATIARLEKELAQARADSASIGAPLKAIPSLEARLAKAEAALEAVAPKKEKKAKADAEDEEEVEDEAEEDEDDDFLS